MSVTLRPVGRGSYRPASDTIDGRRDMSDARGEEYTRGLFGMPDDNPHRGRNSEVGRSQCELWDAGYADGQYQRKRRKLDN